jgi:hypothetical protein
MRIDIHRSAPLPVLRRRRWPFRHQTIEPATTAPEHWTVTDEAVEVRAAHYRTSWAWPLVRVVTVLPDRYRLQQDPTGSSLDLPRPEGPAEEQELEAFLHGRGLLHRGRRLWSPDRRRAA